MPLYKQVEIPQKRDVRCALLSIYGVGKHKSNYVCSRVGFAFPCSVDNLNWFFLELLFQLLDFYTWLEARIRREIETNIMVLKEINSYKGLRHEDFLPVRGQRTRTNARTRKKLRFKRYWY